MGYGVAGPRVYGAYGATVITPMRIRTRTDTATIPTIAATDGVFGLVRMAVWSSVCASWCMSGDIAREPTVADHVCDQDRRFLLP